MPTMRQLHARIAHISIAIKRFRIFDSKNNNQKYLPFNTQATGDNFANE